MGHHSSSSVRNLEWLISMLSPARASPRLPPLRPQPQQPRNLFSSAWEPAAAGDARGCHVTARRVAGGGAARAEAAPRTLELALAPPTRVPPTALKSMTLVPYLLRLLVICSLRCVYPSNRFIFCLSWNWVQKTLKVRVPQ